jgi:glycosyltransferase involved in cell wall biosynthesis
MGLALAERSDVELHLVGGDDALQFFRESGVEKNLHAVPERFPGAAYVQELVGPARLGATVDVVHGVKHILPLRPSRALPVLTVHDMLLRDRPWDYRVTKRALLGVPYGWSLSRAGLVLCVSAAARSRVLSYYPALDGRTGVVPLAASPRTVSADADPVERLRDRTFGLVVGDALRRKNLGLLPAVWKGVRRTRPDAVLAVVGCDEESLVQHSDAWRKLIDEGAAVCLSRVSDAALAWCYQNARVVLCPSYLEGFGLPAVEAEAAGTPVVVSEDPALCAAAPSSARRVPSWDASAWVSAVGDVLDQKGGVATATRPVRQWTDVAEDTVRAIRDRRQWN